MSEAHEKTRIRQLEDAAAHWEHKYVNARQYNRNLEERCKELEAELAHKEAYYAQFTLVPKLTPTLEGAVNPTHKHREFCGALRGMPCICDATPLETAPRHLNQAEHNAMVRAQERSSTVIAHGSLAETKGDEK